MNKILLTLLLLVSQAYAGVVIVSDFDDTIKLTNVASTPKMTMNGLFGRKVFSGMPEFFSEAKSYAEELHVLTASPGFIRRSVEGTLRRHGITFDSIAYKNPFKREGKIEYKVRKISEIINKSSHQLILLGDDVDKDPEVFEEVKKLFPDRILASYIHVVRNREMPEGSIKYYTAAGLALSEFEAGRLKIDSVKQILNVILNEEDYSTVIPDFAHCPVEGVIQIRELDSELSQKALELRDALIRHCTPSTEPLDREDPTSVLYQG